MFTCAACKFEYIYLLVAVSLENCIITLRVLAAILYPEAALTNSQTTAFIQQFCFQNPNNKYLKVLDFIMRSEHSLEMLKQTVQVTLMKNTMLNCCYHLEHLTLFFAGHSAKNQSYTMIDYVTGYIVATSVVDKQETALVNLTMELYDMIRCMHQVLSARLEVDKVFTDQHVMVSQFFRNYMWCYCTKSVN